MIAVRKEITAFADFNNRELLDVGNPHLFVFARFEYNQPSQRVLVVANFNDQAQTLNLTDFGSKAYFRFDPVRDLYTGERLDLVDGDLTIPAQRFYWLTNH